MRDWYDYILKKENKDTLNRFDYTNETLQNDENFKIIWYIKVSINNFFKISSLFKHYSFKKK